MKKHDKINIYCVFFKTGSILLAMKKEENAVGENIRRLRMRNQLKQADLAQKLNISRQSLSAYERGITLARYLPAHRDCRFFQNLSG